MQILVKVELLCREHNLYDDHCPTCQYLRRTEQEWLRQRTLRSRLVQELRKRLTTRDIIITDVR
jgi:hypothetical protein